MKFVNKASYLAGLFEGDGHISISPDNKYSPRFNITFNSKDLDTAKFIQGWIGGYGFIRNKTRENAVVLTVSNLKGLLIIVDLINGKLRTPKVRQFNNLINWLNQNKGLAIPHMNLDKTPLNSNSWLAGFADADGSFDIRYTDGLSKVRIACRFRIDQRKFDPISGESYLGIFKEISTFLKTPKVNEKKGGEYLNISASSLESLKILINYFNNHNLITTKYFNFLDWEVVSKLILSKNHMNNKLEIKQIKNRMNQLRTYFPICDHLKLIQLI